MCNFIGELKKVARLFVVTSEFLVYLRDYAKKHDIPMPEHLSYFINEIENAWEDYHPSRNTSDEHPENQQNLEPQGL